MFALRILLSKVSTEILKRIVLHPKCIISDLVVMATAARLARGRVLSSLDRISVLQVRNSKWVKSICCCVSHRNL